MFRGTRKAEEDVPTGDKKENRRFRIEKLEERIAPNHCGGFGFGGCRACARTGGRVCEVFDL